MRFALFSSLVSRSSAAGASLRGFLALSALMVLTGAKGQGCGTVVEPPPPEPDCGPGFHWEKVCSPCDVGTLCEEQCVPDNICPSGWSQQVVCGGHSSTVVSTGMGGLGPSFPTGGSTPMDPNCWTECVPPPMCPPGTEPQTFCGSASYAVSVGVGGSGGASPAGSGGGNPTGGGWTTASTGGPGIGGMPYPGDCWTECVPVQPYCPPGTEPQTFCGVDVAVSVGVGGTGGSSTSGGGWGAGGVGGMGAVTTGGWVDGGAALPYPGDCWTECVPVQPYCPPGTEPQTFCGSSGYAVSVGVGGTGGSSTSGGWGAGGIGGTGGTGGSSSYSSSYTTSTGFGGMPYPNECWTECVPVQPYCPPGTEPQTVCNDYGSVSVGSGGSGGAITAGSGGAGNGGSSGYSSSYTTSTGFGGMPMPYPSECWTECVPVQPYCPPGTEPQTFCSGTGPAGSGGAGGAITAGSGGADGGSSSYSSSYTTGTGIGGMPMPYPNECWTDCVPVQPYCPPGTEPQTFCSGSVGSGGAGPTGSGGADTSSSGGWNAASTGGMGGTGGNSMPYPNECWTECVPVQPYCPPGTVEQTICEGGTSTASTGVGGTGGMPIPDAPACWTDCVPEEQACPPNMIERHICEETMTSGGDYGQTCWTECVLRLP